MMDELSLRLRSRVVEVLALIGDADEQRRYQASVPHVDVPAELFNQWEECFFPANEQFRDAFSEDEFGALRKFDLILDEVSTQTPRELPVLDVFIGTPAWQRLSEAARTALRTLRD